MLGVRFAFAYVNMYDISIIINPKNRFGKSELMLEKVCFKGFILKCTLFKTNMNDLLTYPVGPDVGERGAPAGAEAEPLPLDILSPSATTNR